MSTAENQAIPEVVPDEAADQLTSSVFLRETLRTLTAAILKLNATQRESIEVQRDLRDELVILRVERANRAK